MDTGKSKQLVFLEGILRMFAVLILRKYEPRIIGITGSLGKTSAKEAVYTVLASRFRVRKNEKNYNNEIGLPLTIIGTEAGGRSIWKWAGVFLKALGILIFPVEYPEILVLEMGADRPGDIKYLAGFLKSELVIVTNISGSHLEFFKTIEKVAEEKWTLVESLGEKGSAAVNIDNEIISKLRSQKRYEAVKFMSYGFSEEAAIRATDISYYYSEESGDQRIKGISFKLNYKGTVLPVRLNNVLARHTIYAALAGISAGIGFGLNLVEIAASLENFAMPSGRMTLVPGIKGSLIIDDTYNSSPVSALAAIDVVNEIKAVRKIVVMGDMLELGKDNESGHRQVGKKFSESGGDIFMAVGRRMKFASEELRSAGWQKDRVLEFPDPVSAGKKLQGIIKPGDLVLIKGSQGMRMEKVVEEVMAEPEKAGQYLCRQDRSWRDKPWKEV